MTSDESTVLYAALGLLALGLAGLIGYLWSTGVSLLAPPPSPPAARPAYYESAPAYPTVCSLAAAAAAPAPPVAPTCPPQAPPPQAPPPQAPQVCALPPPAAAPPLQQEAPMQLARVNFQWPVIQAPPQYYEQEPEVEPAVAPDEPAPMFRAPPPLRLRSAVPRMRALPAAYTAPPMATANIYWQRGGPRGASGNGNGDSGSGSGGAYELPPMQASPYPYAAAPQMAPAFMYPPQPQQRAAYYRF